MSYERLGDVLVSQGELEEGKKYYQESLQVRQKLYESDRTNAGWARDLSVSYDAGWARLGDVLVSQGELEEGKKYYQESLQVRQKLYESDRTNAGWARDLSVSYERLGDVLVSQGELEEGKKYYQESLQLAQKLYESDRTNAGWARDLSVSYERLGDVLVSQGELEEGKKYYQESLQVRQKLYESDRTNAGWARDLSVSYERLGDVLVSQGELEEGKKYYQESLQLAQKLYESDRTNAGWARDLSVSYNKLGDVLVSQGELEEGKKYYQESLQVRQKLYESDRTNAGWARDLSVSYERLGDVLVSQGELEEGKKYYQESLQLAQKLYESDRTNAGWARDLSVSYDRLGDVLVSQGELEEGKKYYQESLQLAQKLYESDRTNTKLQRDIWVSYAKMAQLYEKLPDLKAAVLAWKNVLLGILAMDKEGTLRPIDRPLIEFVTQTQLLRTTIELHIRADDAEFLSVFEELLDIDKTNNKWLNMLQDVLHDALGKSEVAYNLSKGVIDRVNEPRIVCKAAEAAFAVSIPYKKLKTLLARCIQLGKQQPVYVQVGYAFLTVSALRVGKVAEAKQAARAFRKAFAQAKKIPWSFEGTLKALSRAAKKTRSKKIFERSIKFIEQLGKHEPQKTYHKRVEKALSALGV